MLHLCEYIAICIFAKILTDIIIKCDPAILGVIWMVIGTHSRRSWHINVLIIPKATPGLAQGVMSNAKVISKSS